jgi:hypothetical protein
MLYIPHGRCSLKVSLFLNKRNIDFFNEESIGEERCEVCFRPTE